MLPKSFNEYGLLPPGDYLLSLEELRKSLLVKGPAKKTPAWDSDYRGTLVDNLKILVKQLWNVGITQIFINGSFFPLDFAFLITIHLSKIKTIRMILMVISNATSWSWQPDNCKGN